MKALVCWKCGASLKRMSLPIGSFDLCPECRVDLHVCRMCRNYADNVPGKCRKEEADYVMHKEQANYCQYYSLKYNAYHSVESDAVAKAQAELNAMFGSASEASAEDKSKAVSGGAKARAELEALFGGGSSEAAGPKSEAEELDEARQKLEDLFSTKKRDT